MAHPDLASGSPPCMPTSPIVIALSVQWGDMDAFAHVNNTVYLRWFESARIAAAHGRVLGSDGAREHRPDPGVDLLRLSTPDHLPGHRSRRITGEPDRPDQPDDGSPPRQRSRRRIAAEGTSTLVLFDYTSQKPHPVPDAIRQTIAAVEGGKGRSDP